MRFVNPLPFVSDMARARRFYEAVLGINVLEDHGNFVKFESGFALHEGKSLYRTAFGKEPADEGPYGRANLVLYFEVDDLDAAFSRMAGQVSLIHPVVRQEWGQHVFRFHDPDGHIVEIGEPQ